MALCIVSTYNNARMFSLYNFMLNAVQVINCNVCSQGMGQDKRMLELTTIGLYGHDGEWLNCFATISKFVTTDHMRPGSSGVFVFSL